MTAGKHAFSSLPTPLKGVRRWRCPRCGVARRRVVDVGGVVGAFKFPPRSFWMYQVVRGGAWESRRPDCTGLRA